MWKLSAILYSVVATTLAGSAVIVALAVPQLGLDTLWGIAGMAAAGAEAAIPVTVYIAKAMMGQTRANADRS